MFEEKSTKQFPPTQILTEEVGQKPHILTQIYFIIKKRYTRKIQFLAGCSLRNGEVVEGRLEKAMRYRSMPIHPLYLSKANLIGNLTKNCCQIPH